jgi:hypothetical protein
MAFVCAARQRKIAMTENENMCRVQWMCQHKWDCFDAKKNLYGRSKPWGVCPGYKTTGGIDLIGRPNRCVYFSMPDGGCQNGDMIIARVKEVFINDNLHLDDWLDDMPDNSYGAYAIKHHELLNGKKLRIAEWLCEDVIPQTEEVV